MNFHIIWLLTLRFAPSLRHGFFDTSPLLRLKSVTSTQIRHFDTNQSFRHKFVTSTQIRHFNTEATRFQSPQSVTSTRLFDTNSALRRKPQEQLSNFLLFHTVFSVWHKRCTARFYKVLFCRIDVSKWRYVEVACPIDGFVSKWRICAEMSDHLRLKRSGPSVEVTCRSEVSKLRVWRSEGYFSGSHFLIKISHILIHLFLF